MKTFARWVSIALLAALVSARSAHAQATVYNGSGCNPVTFQSNYPTGYGPYIGGYWLSSVHGSPGQKSVLLLGLGGPAQPGWKPGGIFGTGELLCLPPLVPINLSISGQHAVFVPADVNLLGREFCVQAALFGAKASQIRLPAGRPSLELQNALLLQFMVQPTCHGEADCGG